MARCELISQSCTPVVRSLARQLMVAIFRKCVSIEKAEPVSFTNCQFTPSKLKPDQSDGVTYER